MTKMRIISGKDDVELMENFNTFSESIGDGLVSYEFIDRLSMRVFFSEDQQFPREKKLRSISEQPTCSGVCATCMYWTSANLGRIMGARVKWGRCAILNNAAINEAHEACKHYVEAIGEE